MVRIAYNGIELQVINVHLPLAASLRNKSFVKLQNCLEGKNVILAGDLNATPKDLFLNDMVLAEGLSLAGTLDATHEGGRRLDYVMYRGDFREAEYSLESGLSDHRLLRTKLEV